MTRHKSVRVAIVAVALFSFGCAAVFSNGTKEKAPSGTSSGAGGQYTGSAPVTSTPVTLTILAQNSYYSGADLGNAALINQAVKAANVTVNWQLLPYENYAQAVEPRLAAGTNLPDIVELPDLDQNLKYASSGIFISLSDLYDKYGYNMKSFYAPGGPYAGVKSSLTTPDGKMYYVPVISLDKANAPELMIDKVWLDKLGLAVPSTTDQFYQTLLAFKQQDPNGDGKADEIPLEIMTPYLEMLLAPSFGVDLTDRFYADDSGKVHFSFMEPGYKDLVTYLHKLYAQGLLDNEFATLSFDTLTQRFSQNLAGATGLYSWHQSKTLSPLYKSYDGKSPIIMGIPPLKGPNGDQFYWAVPNIVNVFGITRDSKNPEVAFKFLDWIFASPTAHNLFYWGNEGVDYNTVDGKKVAIGKALTDDYREKAGFDPVSLPRYQDADEIRSQFDPWHAVIDANMEKFYKSPFPFVYALPNEADILNQYTTDLYTYCDSMFIKFVTGTASIDSFNDYLQTLKNLHADQILAIKQAQYDRFAKK